MLNQFLKRARQRILQNLLLSEAALSGAILFGGVIVLLVLGTQILEWWVPLALAVVSLSIGLIRVRLQAPSSPAVARTLDQRCSLADALATALHFQDSASPVARAQREQALAAAHAIDLRNALPLVVPRSLYGLAGLALAASLLLFFRYGVEHDLSLAAPIAHLNFDPFRAALGLDGNAGAPKAPARPGTQPRTAPGDLMSRLGTSTPDEAGEKVTSSAPQTAVTTGPRTGTETAVEAAADGKKPESAAGDSSDASQNGAGAPKSGDEPPPSSQDGSPQSAQSGGKTASSDSSGLMSKLRDAVSGLISKMKRDGAQTPQSGPQAAQPPSGKQPSGQNSQKQGAQDAKADGQQQSGDESAASDSEQMDPGKGSGKASDQNASAKPGSGMGHQDGSKELQDAAQLAAMGKLSEIIGKRSAKISGEMTIEPQSGPQQLKTGYTHSIARHGESGGDNSRDEVPVAMQGYVQQYFEQVRKQAAVKTARAGKPDPHP